LKKSLFKTTPQNLIWYWTKIPKLDLKVLIKFGTKPIFFSKLRTMEMKSLQLRIFFESKMGSHVGPMTKIPLIRFVHIQKAMQMWLALLQWTINWLANHVIERSCYSQEKLERPSTNYPIFWKRNKLACTKRKFRYRPCQMEY
jgi:hypothetical protein